MKLSAVALLAVASAGFSGCGGSGSQQRTPQNRLITLGHSIGGIRLGEPRRGVELEGSSALTFPDGGWLERHPGPDEFTCDGKWHTGTWQIAASSEYGHGSLVPGTVLRAVLLGQPGRRRIVARV